MGCTGSKSLEDGDHESITRAALVWPTAGTCPAEVLENVNYVRHDFERWFSHISCKDLEETNLNEVVLYRYISGLWRHIERTVTAENCLRYQFALSGGYGHLEPYSRGLAVKYEQDRKKLRNCMSLCALELTGAILTLQPDTRDEAYNRRRQSMPIMAWTIVHRLANCRMEAGMSPTAPWCGGLIVRTFPHVISSGRWEWQPDSDAVAGPFSKFVESAADGERLLLMAVDVRRNTSNDV